MPDPRIAKMARVLVNHSLDLKEGQKLAINSQEAAYPLIKEVFREGIRMGAYPETRLQLPGLTEILLKEGADHQVEYISPVVNLIANEYDALLSISAPLNTRELSNISPEKMRQSQRASTEIMQTFMKRAAEGKLSWCGTQYPTYAAAQEGNMSLDEYTEFVFGACLLNEKDPIAAWKKIHNQHEKYINHLEKCSELHFKSEDTDLKMNISGRKWENCDGKNNFPDGEIFTAPVEDSVNGHIRFSFPGIYLGREIEDIRLTFSRGKVVNATAKKGEDLLQTILETDDGSSYVGEIAMGTNYGIKHFTKNMLFDEKIGGTIHLALGNGYPETGSKNKSAIHWDLLCDMRTGGEIFADGELIYKDGNFQI